MASALVTPRRPNRPETIAVKDPAKDDGLREVVGEGHASDRRGPAQQPLSALEIGDADDGGAIAQRQQDGAERFCQDADPAARDKAAGMGKDQCRAKADTGGGDREQQMAWRVSQNAGAPGERAEKKQPDRARKDIDVQGSEKRESRGAGTPARRGSRPSHRCDAPQRHPAPARPCRATIPAAERPASQGTTRETPARRQPIASADRTGTAGR